MGQLVFQLAHSDVQPSSRIRRSRPTLPKPMPRLWKACRSRKPIKVAAVAVHSLNGCTAAVMRNRRGRPQSGSR
ncbi:hypothetical protein HMPREF1549_00851, partial [Actinomyces johnsonii F0510]